MTPHISQSQWAVFWRKLENLLNGGMPLMDALNHLYGSSESKLKLFLKKALVRLEAGDPFCEAVGEANPLWYGILLTGERSGSLPDAVSRLAERLDSQIALRSQITSALIYPAMVACLCLVIVFLLSGLLVPRFQQLFNSLDIQEGLPVLTQGVFVFSEFLRNSGGVLVLVVAAIVGLFTWHRSRAGAFYEGILLRLPLLGPLYAQGVGLGVLESLSILLSGQMSLDEALAICARGCSSHKCRKLLEETAQRTREGDSLSSSLQGTAFWDATDIELLSIAEQSGQLKPTTQRLAKLYHQRFVRQTHMATRLIEPLLIMLMALLVGVLLVALFSPLMPLIGRLSEGGL